MTVSLDNRSLSIKLMAQVTSVKVVRSPSDERLGCESFLSRSNLVSMRATFNFRSPAYFIEQSDLQGGRDRSVRVRLKNVCEN